MKHQKDPAVIKAAATMVGEVRKEKGNDAEDID